MYVYMMTALRMLVCCACMGVKRVSSTISQHLVRRTSQVASHFTPGS